MTEEQKQALIADCKEDIESIRWRIDRTVATMGSTAYLESCLKRQQIALAALTAQPVKLPDRYDIGSMIDVEKDDDGPLYLREDVIGAIRAAGYEVHE